VWSDVPPENWAVWDAGSECGFLTREVPDGPPWAQ